MGKRIYNFSAGPAVLPEDVLNEAKESILEFSNTGIGIMEMSHRSKSFDNIIEEAKQNLKNLLNINDEYEVLFIQGGASLQFHMIPLNLRNSKIPSYINTGAWSKKAITESKRLGDTKVIATSEDKNFSYIPEITNSMIDENTSYLHFTSNNTIFGTEFKTEPASNGAYLVCDASSNFLSREIDIKRYGLIYAGAQKNLGPSGVAVVLIRKDLLELSDPNLPPMLSYANHAKSKSLFNTPPTFTIYVIGLVFKWIQKLGGLQAVQKLNEEKAGLLYNFIDNSSFYTATASIESRSNMNVTYRIVKEELESKFISDALENGFSGLKGHRSVGGIRASIYNAFPTQGVKDLIEFMKKFEIDNS